MQHRNIFLPFKLTFQNSCNYIHIIYIYPLESREKKFFHGLLKKQPLLISICHIFFWTSPLYGFWFCITVTGILLAFS